MSDPFCPDCKGQTVGCIKHRYNLDARPIWEVIEEISKSVPDEEWAKLGPNAASDCGLTVPDIRELQCERDSARRFARAWKRLAKGLRIACRTNLRYSIACEAERDALRAEQDALHVEIGRLQLERDAFREEVAALREALENLADGVCHSKYGPGCDGECKHVAYKALDRAREDK